MRRLHALSLAVLCSCTVMLAATVIAHAGGPTRIDGWLLPRELSQSGDDASLGPDLIMDNQGLLHVLWIDDSPGQPDPYYARSLDQGTSWSAVSQVSTEDASYDSALAVGGTGIVHACWWDQVSAGLYRLMYVRRSGTTWGSQQTVVDTTSDIKGPAIALASGYIHVLWSYKLPAQAHDLWYSRRPEGGGDWSEPSIITDTGPASQYGKMAVDTGGNLHVVWHEHTQPNEVIYISGTVEVSQTTWHAPITLTQAITPNATSPDIAVSADGMVHAVFSVDVPGQPRTQDLYHVSFPLSNTSGISPTEIPGSRTSISFELPTYASPALAVDPANNLHVVWNGVREDDLWDRIYYATSQDGGTSWSRVVPVSPDDAWSDGFPDVVADGELVHIVWQQKTSFTDNDVYYSHSLPWVTGFVLAMKEYE